MSNTEFDRVPAPANREQPEQEWREPPRWGWWLGGVGLVAAIVIVVSVLSPFVRHQWALSMIRQNTPYTQLGFSDAAELPVDVVRGKAIPVSFFITNDEGKQTTYQYVVSSGSSTQLKKLSSSSRILAPGATWDVKVTVVPNCAETTCHVQVSLPRQAESIDFIVQDKSAATAK